MEVLRDGTFSENIETAELARGLRPTKRAVRNTKYLVQCSGAVGLDGVLQVIDDIEQNRIDTSAIVDGFPYPQIFVFINVTIVCGLTKIYELVAGSLSLKITTDAGNLWSAVDFHDFVYLSNGVKTVVRDPNSKVYAETTELPIAEAICNFNGQVHVGSPVEE